MPEVALESLRKIAAGNIPENQEEEIPDFGPPEIKVEMCGHREFVGSERRWYECRGAKHNRKTPHQMVAGEEVLD